MISIIYKIICFITEHHYSKEVVVNKNTTRSYCKCGKWLEFDWKYMGGYEKATNKILELKIKNELNIKN